MTSNDPPKTQDGFYRDRDTIAAQTAQVNRESNGRLGEPLSEQAWLAISHLSWRPAWSIRSRQGSLRLLLQWWRDRRAGQEPGG